jgi:hypothetical protein
MGGLFAPKMPKPLPAPAKPVTAVAKTPDIELEGDEVGIAGQKKKKGKKALRTDMISDMGTQTGSAGSGLQIPTGGQ